jgi:hypothetical protein
VRIGKERQRRRVAPIQQPSSNLRSLPLLNLLFRRTPQVASAAIPID